MMNRFFIHACALVLPCLFAGCDNGPNEPIGGNLTEEEQASNQDSSNQSPNAVDDELVIKFADRITLAISTLTENDSDPENDTLSVLAVEPIAGGSVRLLDNEPVIELVPESESSSLIWFEYTLSDGISDSVIAEASITLEADRVRLKAELSEFDAVTLSWSLVSGIPSYDVYRKQEDGAFELMEPSDATQPGQFRDLDLEQGKRYTYKVAFVENGAVNESSEVEILSDSLTPEALYQVKCGVCHGSDGKGVAGFPPLDKPMTVDELVARTEVSSFTRCKIKGGCAQIVSEYVYSEILGLQ